MNLLFTRFPLESSYGGAEVQTISLMQGLASRGHNVGFLGSCETLLKLCRESGLTCEELRIGPPPVSKGTVLTFPLRRYRMRRALEEALKSIGSLDAIIMLSLSEKLLLTPMALRLGIRVVWIEHDGLGPWLTRNPWLRSLRTLSSSVTTIGVSELSRKLLTAIGFDEKRTIAIQNGIDLSRFASVQPRLSAAGGIRIGTVARLTKDKGVDLLIEAAKGIPDARLTIVGRGREETRIRSLVKSADPSGEKFRLIPFVEDLRTFYTDLDVFVLPSRTHDPFGLTAAEAMACGIATVVTDVCGIASHVQHNAEAIVVEANASAAIRTALKRLRDPAFRLRLGDQGRKAAWDRFSLPRMIDAYQELLQRDNDEKVLSPRARA